MVHQGKSGKKHLWFLLKRMYRRLSLCSRWRDSGKYELRAEAIAIREAITHCITVGMNQVCLETDSLIWIKILTKVWVIPWNTSVIIGDIMDASQLCRIQIRHTYRERKYACRLFTKHGFWHYWQVWDHNFSDLPSQAKRILNLDKQEVTYLRIRTKKIKPYIMCGEEEAVFISWFRSHIYKLCTYLTNLKKAQKTNPLSTHEDRITESQIRIRGRVISSNIQQKKIGDIMLKHHRRIRITQSQKHPYQNYSSSHWDL